MRITKIEVANVAGLARADINLNTPVLLVAGANMAGKSSLKDAISMAMTGVPARVSKKKDLDQMVHDGAKKGRATIHGGEEVLGQFTLPKGEFAGPEIKNAEWLPLVIDPAKFAAMSSDERRTALFKITGCSAGMKAIEPLLAKRSLDMAMFEEVKPMLRSGFPAAEKFAQDKAREAKGAWKATTGEQWGSDKAEGWEPEEVTASVDQADLDAATQALTAIDQDLAEAQQTLGQRKAERDAAAGRQQRIAELTELAGLVDRRQAKLTEDENRAAEWTEKLTTARTAAEGGPAYDPLICPCCNMALKLQGTDKGNQLVPHLDNGKTADPEAAKRVTEYEGYLTSAQRAVENSKRDLQQSTDAAVKLEELQDAEATTPSEEALANAQELINDLRQQRASAFAKQQALQEAIDAVAGRAKMIEQAAGWHREVTNWLAIADAMSPEGIPADLLSAALAPINQSLSVLAGMAGWPLVEISRDIEVTSQGRPYGLISESEKWRADTLLALAIAQITELRLVVLDRFDVLEPKARGQVIGLLDKLATMESIDTVIMMGTLKEKPAALPPTFTAAWISNYIVEV